MAQAAENDPEVNQVDGEENRGYMIEDIYIPPPPIPSCTYDSTVPRLMITHITIQNFKSYAGVQTLGPFNKNFTSIIGPNGSGKSNVIDSILFVFGYKARKIRSTKVSVLLHKSDKHRDVQSCSVNVHFQSIMDKPGDSFDVIPNSQFVVTRTAFKDNSSWYAINNKRVQFKDVGNLLRSHGIDLDYNRFLILQGEVEQVSLMKPKAENEHDVGMLGFLEDIIGSSRLEKPIQIFAHRIEEVNQRREEKYNRVKAVEKEKNELEEPMKEAVEYMKVENKIIQKKHVLSQIQKMQTEDNLESAKVEKETMVEQLNEIKKELKELKSNSQQFEEEYDNVSKQISDQDKLIEQLKKSYNALECQDLRCRESIMHCKNRAGNLKKTLQTEQKKLAELKETAVRTEEKVTEFGEKEEQLESRKVQEEEELNEAMQGIKKETKNLQEEKEKFESQLIGLREDVDKAKSEMDIAQSQMNLFLSTEQAEKKKLEDLETEYKTTKTTLEKTKEEVVRIRRSYECKSGELQQKKKDLQKLNSEKVRITQEVQNVQAKLEEAKSSMQAFQGRNKLLNVLMQYKLNGELPGILGRLGDLGAIDQKYDIAISTACGALDNIVTDTLTTAERCVELLKQHSLGVATFIALDKMDVWIPHTKKRVQTPENVPRLYDLVQVENENLRPAFYYALRETLVADTLDQAMRISFQRGSRHRIVTLKGELIDVAGTLSGGGRPISGRMGHSVRTCEYTKEQVQEMSAQLSALDEQRTKIWNEHDALESGFYNLEREVGAAETSLHKAETDIQILKEKEPVLKQRIQTQKKVVADACPDKTRLEEMNTELESLKKAYEKACRTASLIEEKVQQIHGRIMQVIDSKVSAKKKKLEETEKELDSLRSALSKAKAGIKTTQRNIKQCENKIKNTESDIVDNDEKNSKYKEEMVAIEADAIKIKEELERANEHKQSLCEKIQVVNQEVQEYRNKQAELNRQQIDVENELDKCNGMIKSYTSELKRLESEISKMQLQEIPGETLEPLQILSKEDMLKLNYNNVKLEMTVIKEQLVGMKPNMAAITEYRKKEAQFLERLNELEQITNERDKLQRYHDDLRKQRLNEFMMGFSIISIKLKEVYQMLTLGGDADLELVDSLDPFSEGIVFSVRPPRKSWKNISNLSGGEKTLSSLALIFALHYYKPTPFYVMDEIDAALDVRNVSIVGHYIKELTKNAQFIVISLRDNMFGLADTLVGIYKTHDCTKNVTIIPAELLAEGRMEEMTAEESSETVNREENGES